MDLVNPLNPLLGKIEKFEQSDFQLKQWESSRVEWTLRRLKLERQRKEILSESVGGKYTFAEFNRVVDFPMYLAAEPMIGTPPIHRDPHSIHPMWFKSFCSLPFVKLYEEKLEAWFSGKRDRPLGMVFPRKGFLHGLILHNGDLERFIAPQSSCHVFKGGKKHMMNLIVQPYTGFIDNLKGDFSESH
jgi:hypothetical protein